MDYITVLTVLLFLVACSGYPLLLPSAATGPETGRELVRSAIDLMGGPNPQRLVLALACIATLLYLLLVVFGSSAETSVKSWRCSLAAGTVALGASLVVRLIFQVPLNVVVVLPPPWLKYVPVWLYPGSAALLLMPYHLRPNANLYLHLAAFVSAVFFLAAYRGETAWTMVFDMQLYRSTEDFFGSWRETVTWFCCTDPSARSSYQPLSRRLVEVTRGIFGMRVEETPDRRDTIIEGSY